jgi:thiol-disulfide isomerase/thioredoxin
VLRAIHIVYADWCPHCVPVTVEPVQRAAKELGVPCVLHNIDTDDVKTGDDLVKRYGDWTQDYLIPQVFLEMDDGKIEHVMTGDPRGIQHTKRAVETLLKSKLAKQMV